MLNYHNDGDCVTNIPNGTDSSWACPGVYGACWGKQSALIIKLNLELTCDNTGGILLWLPFVNGFTVRLILLLLSWGFQLLCDGPLWLWRTFNSIGASMYVLWADYASGSAAVSAPSRCPLLLVVISILAGCCQLFYGPEGPIRAWQLHLECHHGMKGAMGGWGCCIREGHI